MSTIQDRFDELTADDDLSVEEFEQYMKELTPRFFTFHRKMVEANPEEYKTAMSKAEWIEEFQAFVDTLDGEKT